MKKYLALFFIVPFLSISQTAKKPKLVVGIVVDQMRNEYIYRYWNRFGDGGFKRLVNEGQYFRNAHYNYVPTYTGPGHASIYTGTSPRYHGIIANEWYDKSTKKYKGCVKDESVKGIGTDAKAGLASPQNLLSSTIGDELKLANTKSKVFAVAIKDRSAILPAGHAADGAFWMDESSGDFISSSAYMQTLPKWLSDFNAEKKAANYLKTGWNTLYPIATYTNSLGDDNSFEDHPFSAKPVFPYDFQKYIDTKNVGIIRGTPYGNSITKDLALRCIENEQLGKDDYCDLFSISFSSTDIIAHSYGPRSIEVEDVYLRLDKDLAELFLALDTQVGDDNYVVLLTADHRGAEVSAHMNQLKIPAGTISDKTVKKTLQHFLSKEFGDTSLLLDVGNEQVFLDVPKIQSKKLNLAEIEEKVASALLSIPGIAEAYSSAKLKYGSFPERDIRHLLQNGCHQLRSGNVLYALQPGWMDNPPTGTTHGAAYNYDTHVPLLFYGATIPKGENLNFVTITQIAPSVCELIGIPQPNACLSPILKELFK